MNKDFIKGAITGYLAKSVIDTRQNDDENKTGIESSTEDDATAAGIMLAMIALSAIFGFVMFIKAWHTESFPVAIGAAIVCFFIGMIILYALSKPIIVVVLIVRAVAEYFSARQDDAPKTNQIGQSNNADTRHYPENEEKYHDQN